MTEDEATNLIQLMRGMWSSMYLRDEGEFAWRFFFEDKDLHDSLAAVRLLASRQADPPAMAHYVAAIKETKGRKYACPRCGHAVQSEAAVAEHLANVHGEYA